MKIKFFTISLLLALGFSAKAALYTYSGGDAVIPDNSTIGLPETITDISEPGSITAVPEPVNVALGIFGGMMGVLAVVRFVQKAKMLKSAG